MTREEAIKRLEVVRTNALIQKANGASEYWQEEIDGTIEAIDMAIEALSQPIVAKHFDIQSGYIYCSPQIAENVKVVVRCKDCIRNNDGNFCDIAFFINDDGDGFCNCGERKKP